MAEHTNREQFPIMAISILTQVYQNDILHQQHRALVLPQIGNGKEMKREGKQCYSEPLLQTQLRTDVVVTAAAAAL